MIRRHKGFSLLEILVAFAIMAVALTIVLRIFGSGVNAAVISEEYNLAVQLAESLAARTGVETPLQVGETFGSEADKYDWLVKIAPVAEPPVSGRRFPSQQDQPAQPSQKLMKVSVRVSWGEDVDRQRSVQLDSLRIWREPVL
ncbi:MAG: type II secretion system GspH family protein [Methylomonas sp.]|jgi:general secretion pathway protein I|uniref:type IV pilus modification PilV family protein n=1 Tax=Methylomonas sp. TaxID=418 RepID=UPI0025E4F97B|nr:type II secretion system protein [Methylomonas sp.]MCK9605654.1 type II secretion system GspH family protein [Methylomonas sp.]